MQFVPAIDLLDGEVVRLFQGDYGQKTKYDRDPLEMLRIFEDAGCSWIHVVDLTGAKAGGPKHLDILEKLSAGKKSGTVIEWGGGIRTINDVKAADNAGADRIILGSALIKNPELLQPAIEAVTAERIIAGIDAKDGQVKVSGWEEGSGTTAVELAAKMADAGLKEIIFTDISTDGTLAGPAMESFERMLTDTSLSMVASGGIGNFDHLAPLKELAGKFGDRLRGIICGRAIYEGTIDVAEAQSYLNS